MKIKKRQILFVFCVILFGGVAIAGFSVFYPAKQQSGVMHSSASGALPSDINNSGIVDVFDLSMLLSKWGTTDTQTDINDDGIVNSFDLSILLANWGAQAPVADPCRGTYPTQGSSMVFTHPGVLVGKCQLDFVKTKLAQGAQPWTAALAKMKTERYASLNYTHNAVPVVSCGLNNNPFIGCNEEKNDATAAYTHALLWYYTGNVAHAQKAVDIMNDWSSTLTSHTEYAAPLQAAWGAEMFTRAAEIIRYTSNVWSATDIQKFEDMLVNVYMADMTTADATQKYASYNGNWHLSAIDAAMGIGVFTENKTIFDNALAAWRARTPAYIYLQSDNGGNGLPVAPPGGLQNTTSKIKCFWLDNMTGCGTATLSLANGHGQESCRDLYHTGMGFASMINAAETAYIQGVDLYEEQRTRIMAGFEFMSGILVANAYPPGMCNGQTLPAPQAAPTYEIGYNHYANRKGRAMPLTQQLVSAFQANGGTGTSRQMMAWETLTHANSGGSGL